MLKQLLSICLRGKKAYLASAESVPAEEETLTLPEVINLGHCSVALRLFDVMPAPQNFLAESASNLVMLLLPGAKKRYWP